MTAQKNNTLRQHLAAVKAGERVFENAFQGIIRMILEPGFEKVVVNAKTTYDFKSFGPDASTPSGCTTRSTVSSHL